ncbi:MAG: hypothetical protein J4400_04460 [Candidatus Aenigmarchaeota archaeon]|nr:hypothetical protein [Candidatus Aenigmarchaeota archaeon]
MINKNKVKICPSCRKPTIEFFIGLETGNYSCRCGYVGPIVIEVEKTRKKNIGRKNK